MYCNEAETNQDMLRHRTYSCILLHLAYPMNIQTLFRTPTHMLNLMLVLDDTWQPA